MKFSIVSDLRSWEILHLWPKAAHWIHLEPTNEQTGKAWPKIKLGRSSLSNGEISQY